MELFCKEDCGLPKKHTQYLLIRIQIRQLDKPNKRQVVAIKKAIAKQCSYVYALWVSPSQRGLKGLIRTADDLIKSDADFKRATAIIDHVIFFFRFSRFIYSVFIQIHSHFMSFIYVLF